MKLASKRGVVLAALAAVLAATLGAVEAVNNSFERTLTVSEPVELSVHTGSGDISIRAGDADRVQVKGTVNAPHSSAETVREIVEALEADPPIEQDGNAIGVGDLRRHRFGKRVSISYELVVPPRTSVESKTGSGDHAIRGVAGPVEALTGSGDIELVNISDRAGVKTGSGNIKLANIGDEADIKTGSGDIELDRIAGAVSITTGSGTSRRIKSPERSGPQVAAAT